MIKLYGFPVSNYYNIAKAALLEAGVEFEDIRTIPSQEDDYLAVSPMGKVPAMEVDGTVFTEASVMVDYVAEHLGGSLYPDDPVARAQVRELMRYVDLYIDLAARPCFREALFGGTVADAIKEKSKADLEQGVAALKRRARFAPYIAGAEPSYADFAAYFSIPLANMVAKRLFDWDFMADWPELTAMMEKLAERQSVATIEASRQG